MIERALRDPERAPMDSQRGVLPPGRRFSNARSASLE
jgi:hypothetical protein